MTASLSVPKCHTFSEQAHRVPPDLLGALLKSGMQMFSHQAEFFSISDFLLIIL